MGNAGGVSNSATTSRTKSWPFRSKNSSAWAMLTVQPSASLPSKPLARISNEATFSAVDQDSTPACRLSSAQCENKKVIKTTGLDSQCWAGILIDSSRNKYRQGSGPPAPYWRICGWPSIPSPLAGKLWPVEVPVRTTASISAGRWPGIHHTRDRTRT
jgi:hypothetical protein